MLEILGSLWISILETLKFIIPHWVTKTVALAFTSTHGDYEIIGEMEELEPGEKFDAFMTIESVLCWGNTRWPTITGEEPIYPAIMFHTIG